NNVHFYPSDSKIFFQLVGLVMASYESRWKLKHNAFLKLNASLPKGRSAGSRCGIKLLVFYEN
ncbi:hypothetical protein ACO2JP_18040, partial [Leptospira kirschneri]|uniref:hypothetical protein n=1 Tax=Leptospira kirschneri TaxID=29507 RepID=UPI003D057C09